MRSKGVVDIMADAVADWLLTEEIPTPPPPLPVDVATADASSSTCGKCTLTYAILPFTSDHQECTAVNPLQSGPLVPILRFVLAKWRSLLHRSVPDTETRYSSQYDRRATQVANKYGIAERSQMQLIIRNSCRRRNESHCHIVCSSLSTEQKYVYTLHRREYWLYDRSVRPVGMNEVAVGIDYELLGPFLLSFFCVALRFGVVICVEDKVTLEKETTMVVVPLSTYNKGGF
ncbi:hypothetical protein CBL_13787 [Carabus blaptoides fortunei]